MFKRKKIKEPTYLFSGEDQGMQEAIKLAQKNFPKFKEELKLESRRIVPAITDCLIKYAFPSDNKDIEMEHMFLSDIHIDGENVIGILASKPINTKKVKEGDKIIVDLNRVSDWLYIIDGKAYGGYTFRYMWKTFSINEKNEYQEEPPFCWLKLD